MPLKYILSTPDSTRFFVKSNINMSRKSFASLKSKSLLKIFHILLTCRNAKMYALIKQIFNFILILRLYVLQTRDNTKFKLSNIPLIWCLICELPIFFHNFVSLFIMLLFQHFLFPYEGSNFAKEAVRTNLRK